MENNLDKLMRLADRLDELKATYERAKKSFEYSERLFDKHIQDVINRLDNEITFAAKKGKLESLSLKINPGEISEILEALKEMSETEKSYKSWDKKLKDHLLKIEKIFSARKEAFADFITSFWDAFKSYYLKFEFNRDDFKIFVPFDKFTIPYERLTLPLAEVTEKLKPIIAEQKRKAEIAKLEADRKKIDNQLSELYRTK